MFHATKIMDWFKDDFEKWSAGRVAFIAHYVTSDEAQADRGGRQPDHLKFDDYDWKLNDASK